MDALDSRQDKPKSWDEVNQLQEALQLSIRSFTRVTSRSPPSVPGSPWLSYASQLDILQGESDRFWSADRRPGAPPKLARLAAWRGGISMVGGARSHITEEMTEQYTHPELRGCRHPDGSPDWHQDTILEPAYEQFQSILLAADARRGSLITQAAEARTQQDVSKSITATLDKIVARDPERYLAWLSTMGYFYFTMIDHNPYAFSWEEWCAWNAPTSFEVCCNQASAARKPPLDLRAMDRSKYGPPTRPPLGLEAIDNSKYGPPGDRPTITLEEAKKGNRRAMEFIDTPGGLEVLLTERAQYYMIGGEATSREAAAHSRAVRGQDVWLFEPMDSAKEAYFDSSRKREVELEASFRC